MKRKKPKHLAMLFILLCFSVTLLTGCTLPETPLVETPPPTVSPTTTPTEAPGTAGFVLPYYPEEPFHPLTGSNRTNQMLTPLLYEGLFQLDTTFTPTGLLCQSHSVSEDGLLWTLTLRAGVTFSDGTPLTAADAVRALQSAQGESSAYASRMTNLKTIRAVDELTLSIALHRPNGNLPALLDLPIGKESGEALLGTGPYVYDSEGGALRRNSSWWQGKALPVEEIGLYPIKAADGLAQAFDTREISLVAADLTGINALGFSGSYEVWDYPTSVLLYTGYNTRRGLCADVAVRGAIRYALDRTAATRSLLSGHATAAALPIPPSSPLYDAALAATLEYDTQKAQEQLNAAGWTYTDGVRYKGGQPLSLSLIVNTDNRYKVSLAEMLAKDLAKVGVAVEVKKLTWEAYNAALSAGEFDLYLGQVKLTGDFDLAALLTRDGALNYGGYADPPVEVLLDEYRAADDATRPAAASNLCRAIGEGVPITPICFKNWSVLTHWGKLSGVQATQQNVFHNFPQWRIP